jgi:hypothetical protein
MDKNTSSFEDYDNRELALKFTESRGTDKNTGAEIMRRVIIKAGLNPDEWSERILKSNSGEPVRDSEGNLVKVADYLCDTPLDPMHQRMAARGILEFLLAGSISPEERMAMADTIIQRTL